jgi:antitoxin HigA-1
MPAPVQPGAVLRERFLEPLELTSGQVARAIGVVPDSVPRISREEMHLSAKMAVRFGRYFGNG